MDWSLEKVLEWLKLIKLEDEYIEIIKEHKIDGKMLINLNHSELLFNLGIEPYGVRHHLLHEIKKLTSNNIKTTICKKSPNKSNNIEDFRYDKENKCFVNNNINISNSSDTVANAIQGGNIKANGIASNTKINEVKENGIEISYMHEPDPIKWSSSPPQSSNIKNNNIYNTWDLNLDKLREINKFRNRLEINNSNSIEHSGNTSGDINRKLLLSHIKEHYLAWRECNLKIGTPKLETSEVRKGGFISELINRLKEGLLSMLDNIIESSYTSKSEMKLDLLKLDAYLNQIYLYTSILNNHLIRSLKGVNIQKLNQISKLLNTSVKEESSKYSKFYTNVFDNNKKKAVKGTNIRQLVTDLIVGNIEDIKKFQRGESNENNVSLQFSNLEFREANGLIQDNSKYNSSSYSEEQNDTLSSPQPNYILISSDIYSDTFAEPEVIILSD